MLLKKTLSATLFLLLLASSASSGQIAPASQAKRQEKSPPSDDIEILTPLTPKATRILEKNYLPRAVRKVKKRWYRLIPPEARSPEDRPGKVFIRFTIHKNGKVTGIAIYHASGDKAMDRVALNAVADSAPFRRLPRKTHLTILKVQFNFLYNITPQTPRKQVPRHAFVNH